MIWQKISNSCNLPQFFLTQHRILDLSYNNLVKLPSNPPLDFPRLVKLSLKKNNLKGLSGIEKFQSLTYLKLSRNDLSSLGEIKKLSNLKTIKGISLYRNPVSDSTNPKEYIQTLVTVCPNLESLDHIPIQTLWEKHF